MKPYICTCGYEASTPQQFASHRKTCTSSYIPMKLRRKHLIEGGWQAYDCTSPVSSLSVVVNEAGKEIYIVNYKTPVPVIRGVR